ncbi:MAG: hypothetical protein K0R80_2091 [Clostridia bacterium]|nr:hypothetical protein [Clostridia bacterium]
MENKKTSTLRILMGILGVGVIALSITLFTTENAGEIFKAVFTSLLQVNLGLLLLVFGISENRSKGKPKGNMYFVVGLAVLTSTAFTIYDLFTRLAQ